MLRAFKAFLPATIFLKFLKRGHPVCGLIVHELELYTVGSWENVHKRGEGESQLAADVLRGLLRTEGSHVRSFTTVHVTFICTNCTDSGSAQTVLGKFKKK